MAQSDAAACSINAAITELNPNNAEALVEAPDSTDIGILFYKLARRLQLYALYPTQVSTTEFCTQPGSKVH